MLNREISFKKPKFARDEDGALLVFFAFCVAAIFLIAALSFDLGRRASTQTEIQSYVDNVSLAAAGELNGFPGAIARAETAASSLISDTYVFGTDADGDADRTMSGVGDYHIYFYDELPPIDATDLLTVACGNGGDGAPLCTNDPANDFIARFVLIAKNTDPDPTNDDSVVVPWVFANLLTIFSRNPPDERVSAEAVAGYTSLACDIAPVFFCMPTDIGALNDDDLADEDGDKAYTWHPTNHIGEQILLRTGQQGSSFWDSGNFGWLDPRDLDPYASLVDSGGSCAGLNGSPLLVCLIAAEHGVVNCYENGLLTTLPGQKQGIESAVFNTRYDMFNATVSQYKANTNFQPGPIVTRGFADSSGDACLKNATTDISTMELPVDDCFVTGVGLGCVGWNGVMRYGNGDWTNGRIDYVEQNYSTDYATYQWDPALPPIIDPLERYTGTDGLFYHIDDPFRKDNPNGFPELPPTASRWQYYVAQTVATYYKSPVTTYDDYIATGILATDDDSVLLEANVADVESLMPPLMEDFMNNNDPLVASSYNDDIPHYRGEDGFPKCATDPGEGGLNAENFSLDPRRLVVVAAIVNCEVEEVSGKKNDVLATYFVETFISQPVKGDPVDKTKFDMYIEIIGPPLNIGLANTSKGTFRNLVQIYR